MLKIVFTMLFVICTMHITATAQYGFGTNQPDQKSIIDAQATDKGVLIPRVALSATNSYSPFEAWPQASMLVYNTATAGTSPNNVKPGFYYSTGTSWVQFVSSPVAQSITVNADGTVTIGDGTNQTKFEADGTITSEGNATVWDDLRVQILTRTAGTPPVFTSGFAGNSSLFTYQFDDNSTKSVYFEVQMPHSWKGTTIYPHVHWSPATNNSGTVKWVLDYTWVNINGTFGTMSSLALDGLATANTQWKHYIASNDNGITPTSSQSGISSMLICRLSRVGGDTGDNLTGDACLLAFDIHFEKDTEGSRTMMSK